MQGIFINGRRPKSKKEIRDIAAADPAAIEIEATSMFGNDFGGRAIEAPAGTTILFVGPDPYTSRKFYGKLIVGANGLVVK